MSARRPAALLALARAHGVSPWFRDAFEQRRDVPAEVLHGVLGALGVDASDPAEALRAHTAARWGRLTEPVAVAPAGEPGALALRLPAARADGPAEVVIEREDGEHIESAVSLADLAPSEKADTDAGSFVVKQVPLPALPAGYHRAHVRAADVRADVLVIASPVRAPANPTRTWGVFAPLYALPVAADVATYTDLGELMDRVAELGGGLVSTLPLLATFLGEPYEPSPYSPVSRLFWSELYVDLAAAPELDRVPGAREAIASMRARDERLIDPRAAMAARVPVLASLAAAWADGPAVLAADPELEAYARFRAATDAHGPFAGWPGAQPPPVDGAAVLTHAYAQSLARAQLRALDASRATLLFDLPVGVHRDGFDAWRHADAFAAGASAGAPPDSFFTGGQDWTFAPLHPERIRESGYAYPIACLRHMLSHARVLRVDHVMGLHRLWWIPAGAAPHEGAYVASVPEEWYAILALEAARADAMIVGEDLGTVPSAVRRSMARHNIHRIYVVQEELDEQRGMRPVRADAVASLNTHDMPPFAAFWEALDIERRIDGGLLDTDGAAAERARRARLRDALLTDLRARGLLGLDEDDAAAVARACILALGASRARAVVVALEDLLGETEPQNTPGVAGGASWRRRMRASVADSFADPEVLATLTALAAARAHATREGAA